MIRDLPSTSTRDVVKELLRLRDGVGAMAMGRVLTLVVSVEEDGADEAVRTANDATRQHPARIIVLVRGNARGRGRLDAQIRVGGDAGASEIVVLRLYGELTRHEDAVVTPLLLPDSPVVTWWPGDAPADVAGDDLGRMAHRRITDALAAARPPTELRRRARHYAAGDTDLAWTRITRWRALLASSLESAPFEPVTSATVTAEAAHPGADLLAGWLAHALRCPVQRARSAAGTGLVSVRLDRDGGPVDLVRTDDGADTATLSREGSLPRLVALHTPGPAEALADELRRLDADEVYAAALCEGLPLVRSGGSRTDAVRRGAAPKGPAPVDTGDRTSLDSDRLDRRPPAPTGAEDLQEHVEQRLAEATRADLRVHADKDALGTAVARELARRVEDAVAERGTAHVALTGGSMGGAVVSGLADLVREGALERASWRQVHVWWGDERFLPAGDPDRNDTQADAAGLDQVPVLVKHTHRVPGGADPARLESAVARYAVELARWADAPSPVPELDVVLLGVGPDAHVASLFPGRDELDLVEPATTAVRDSPKPPPSRVSLTLPAINAARAVWLVVAGPDKAEAVAASLDATDDHDLPASCVHGRQETVWWVDEAAAAQVEGQTRG
ncbi:6-phosphogluconolactonase [Ornithinimicrobium sp. W1665]|uniref:6-phosphogluconolactonase n=1 Tax=Ornithinimicrobium sp. W1665 TaxID=3416666 RepID=UPI003CEFDD1D